MLIKQISIFVENKPGRLSNKTILISERFPLLILKISVYSDLLSMTRIKRVTYSKEQNVQLQ